MDVHKQKIVVLIIPVSMVTLLLEYKHTIITHNTSYSILQQFFRSVKF